MKKIQLDTFMDFRMLSSLTYSPDGSKLAYILTGIDREKKEYISRLRLRVGDADRLMVSDGKIGEFFFEDDEHIPVWNGALPQVALDYINQQISKLDQASLIIAFKTSDFYARGFCSRAEYHIEQRNGMRLLSLDIPDSQSNEPDEIFVNQLVDTVIAKYFI